MKLNTNQKIITVLALFGVLLASYLFYNFLYKPAIQPCYINSTVNCDAVTKGEISTFLGIPVAIYGLLGYLAILFGVGTKNNKLVLGMALFGTVFCLRLTILEIFFLKVICPVCLTCQVVMILIFIISLIEFKKASKISCCGEDCKDGGDCGCPECLPKK